jgi:hypothetical protein
MSRRVLRVGVVNVLLVVTTGLGPLYAQESQRNMFEGLFGPPLRTPPSFSRPEATILPGVQARPTEDESSTAQPEPRLAAADPSEAASTAAIRSKGRSRSLTLAPQPRPHASRARSIQKRPGTERSEVRLNRSLAAKPASPHQGGNSRGWVKRTAPWGPLATSVAPRLPHRLTPRHARSE